MEMLYTVRWLLNGIVLSHISGLLNAVNVFLEQKQGKISGSRKSFAQIQPLSPREAAKFRLDTEDLS